MEVKIEKFDDLGNGLAKVNEKVCFVKRALPGEVVALDVIKDKKSYLKSKISDILVKSDNRINPICQFYDKCGGCQFLHTTSLLEKEFKITKAKNYLGRCDYFLETSDYNYRNKVTLHVKKGLIGYYQELTNDLIPITYCYLVSEKINQVISLLNNYKDENFDGQVLIRENNKKEIMLVINGNYKYLDYLKNEEVITNLIANDKVIKGQDYFEEEVLGYKFKVHYQSFFQVNREGLLKIFQILIENFQTKKINLALDLYSGTSVLGIIVSKFSKRVVSIEENKFASLDAFSNLKLNNITNLEIINGLVEDNLIKFPNPDLIIVDPARRGLDKKTTLNIINFASKYLVYISCEMASLKRDLKELTKTYNLEKIYLVDMFPKTNKVETVAILTLNKN